MRTEEQYDDGDDGRPPPPYVDGAWGRTANPNTADGELQNIAAFGAGLTRLTGRRRTAVKIFVWLILIGVSVSIIYGIIGIARM